MSIKVMSAIWERSPSKENKLLALLAIADNADDDGWAYPSQNTLAKKVRVKRRAMQKILDQLENEAEVIIYNRVDPSNLQQHFSNVYHLAKYGNPDTPPPHELRGKIKAHILQLYPSVQKDARGGDVQKDATVAHSHTLPDVPGGATVAYPETHESLQEPSSESSKESKKTPAPKKRAEDSGISHAQKSEMIAAWWNALPVKPDDKTYEQIFKIPTYFKYAENMLKAGRTPYQVETYVKAQTAPKGYHHDKSLTLAKVAQDCGAWCAANKIPAQPIIYRVEPPLEPDSAPVEVVEMPDDPDERKAVALALLSKIGA